VGLDPAAAHPTAPLVRYLVGLANPPKVRPGGGTFFADLALLHWATTRAPSAGLFEDDRNVRDLAAAVRQMPPLLRAYLAVHLLNLSGGRWTEGGYPPLEEAERAGLAGLRREVPGLAYAVRYRALRQAPQYLKMPRDFRDHIWASSRQGILPPGRAEFWESFYGGVDKEKGHQRLLDFLWEGTPWPIRHGRRSDVPAWMAAAHDSLVDWQPFLAAALDGASPAERRQVWLAAMECRWRLIGSNQDPEGLQGEIFGWLTALRNEPGMADDPDVLRLIATFAFLGDRQELFPRTLERLVEHAWTHLPAEYDPGAVGRDLGMLLVCNRYQAPDLALLADEERDALASRVIRAADLWRLLDPASYEPGRQAGRILHLLDKDELAWAFYATTVVHPAGEEEGPRDPGEGWRGLGEVILRDQQNPAWAERAIAAALRCDPDNRQYLLARADALRRLRRVAEARAVLGKLAEGSWADRGPQTQSEARKALEEIEREVVQGK
jgi:hypothetical protein